jgi:hypothetical protein
VLTSFNYETAEGIELANKIQALVGVNVRIPTGYLGNFRFSKLLILNIKRHILLKLDSF